MMLLRQFTSKASFWHRPFVELQNLANFVVAMSFQKPPSVCCSPMCVCVCVYVLPFMQIMIRQLHQEVSMRKEKKKKKEIHQPVTVKFLILGAVQPAEINASSSSVSERASQGGKAPGKSADQPTCSHWINDLLTHREVMTMCVTGWGTNNQHRVIVRRGVNY